MAWKGDSEGHRKAALKGHHGSHGSLTKTYRYVKTKRASKKHPAGQYVITEHESKRHRGLIGPRPAPKGRRRTGLKKR